MPPLLRRLAATLALLLVTSVTQWLPAQASSPDPDHRHNGIVTDGALRIEVLTSTLLRLEYAADGHFENRPTFNAVDRNFTPPPYAVHRSAGTLEVRTTALTMRYKEGAGPVGPTTTTVDFKTGTAQPAFGSPAHSDALGGWYRGLDYYAGQAGPIDQIKLHQGMLNRSGWYLLDDTTTAVATPDGWTAPRPTHQGAYQDGYFFGYGHDYKRALADLNTLTGPADMLPKWAFGNWFSEYNAFTAAQYENQLIPSFRANKVPLDALVTDTDWKAPNTWAGWNWNPALFPDPQAYLNWANSQHLHPTLNIHAAISENDPQYASAQAIAKGKLAKAAQTFAPNGHVFDWSDKDQAAAWQALHIPFEKQGVQQWWLDYCCDNSNTAADPGLTTDSWANELYKRAGDARGLRGFSLARIGASYPDYTSTPAPGPWGERRSTVHFTGDTTPDWNSLAFEAAFTQAENSIGVPYVSDDIGSFAGKHLPDDLYLRWVQLGAFQPVNRLHSDHGDRLPWQYGPLVAKAAESFLRLRESLVPYLYATGQQAYSTGMPMARALYLDSPEQATAYTHPAEYMLGDQLLVAPVTTPGLTATTTVWFPAGTWTDLFTGATYQGPGEQKVQSTPDQMPVFAKAGGILPMAPYADNTEVTPAGQLTLKVFPHASSATALYDDAGQGLAYRSGQFARTPLYYSEDGGRGASLRIAPAAGHYQGEPASRDYTVKFVDVSAPAHVTVDGHAAAFSYDQATHTLTVDVPKLAAERGATISHDGRALTIGPPPSVDLTLTAPNGLTAGQTSQVIATVHNGGPATVSAVNVTLDQPAGWTVTPTTPTSTSSLGVGATFQATFNVTPSTATGQEATGSVTFRTADGATYSVPAGLAVAPRQIAVTFKVRVPAGTPAGDKIYIPGSLDQLGPWDPGKVALTDQGGGIWSGTITVPDGTAFNYKYTRGNWNTVEDWGTITGLTSRNVTVLGDANGAMLIDDTATNWSDTSVPDDHKAIEYWRDPVVVSTNGTSTKVDVTFQRTIAPTATLAGTVAITSGGTTVTGTVTQPSPNVLEWTPATPLPAGTYTVTVTGVTSTGAGGVPIEKPYTTTFTV